MAGVPPSTTDRDAVAQLLGRDPIGHFLSWPGVGQTANPW